MKKGKVKTNGKEIREFFYGLKNVKVAIEASTNYSYIVDALVKEGYEVLGGRFNKRKFTSNIMDSSKGNKRVKRFS